VGDRHLLRRNRDFRLFWAGQGLSEYGSQLTQVVLPLVAVVSLNAGAGEVGLLAAVQRISFPILGLFAGVWLDRLDRRRVLLATDLGQAVVLALVPLAWFAGVLSMPLLLAVALVAGAMYVFFEIGYFSYVPNLVRPADLLAANSALQTTAATAMIVGPVLGGVLVAAVGPAPTLLFDVASFLVSFGFLMSIHERRRGAAEAAGGGFAATDPPPAAGERPRRMLDDVRAGWRRVYRNPVLRGLAEMSGIYLFFYTAFQALVVLFLVDELRMSGSMVGIFFAAFGVGVIGGAVVGPPVSRRLGLGPAIVVAAAVADLAAVLTSVLARQGWPGWTLAACAAVVMGVGTQVTTVNAVSIRQALTPTEFLGRVNGTMRVIAWSVTPLGGLFGAAVGTWLGVRGGLTVAATGTLLAVVRIGLSPVARLRAMPSGPDGDPRPGTDGPDGDPPDHAGDAGAVDPEPAAAR
jgi:MFS family permease